MTNQKKPQPLIFPSSDPLKLKLSVFLLFILALWNIIYNILLIMSNYLSQIPEPMNYYLPLFSMIFMLFFSFLTYSFYDKRQKIANMLHYKLSEETIIAIFYFIIIVFQSLFPRNYIDLQIKHQDYLLNFITLLILSNIMFILLKSLKIKVFLVIFLTGFWLYFLLCSNSFENQIELIKLLIQVFMNLSLIIPILYYEKTSKNLEFVKKTYNAKQLNKKKTLIKGNKTLFKFLNSLNSGILLYDRNMELMFFNRKMKKFFYKNPDKKTKSFDFSESCDIEEEKNAKNSLNQCLYKLRNIKCFIPDEKETDENSHKV